MWAAYNGLQGPLYQHGTVNHTYNFVDPQTGVTTNHVEAMWCRAKTKFKSMMGSTNREMITDYFIRIYVDAKIPRTSFFSFLGPGCNNILCDQLGAYCVHREHYLRYNLFSSKPKNGYFHSHKLLFKTFFAKSLG